MTGAHRITQHRWPGFSDEDLADAIDALNAGPGPSAVASAVGALHEIASSLYELDTTLHDSLGKIGVDWQTPESSELAEEAIRKSKRYAGDSGDQVSATGGDIERQADAYARARDGVPSSAALRGKHGGSAFFALAMSGGGALTAHGQQDATVAHEQQREARAQAVHALQGYNEHSDTALGSHQPLPSPTPSAVRASPPPAPTGTSEAGAVSAGVPAGSTAPSGFSVSPASAGPVYSGDASGSGAYLSPGAAPADGPYAGYGSGQSGSQQYGSGPSGSGPSGSQQYGSQQASGQQSGGRHGGAPSGGAETRRGVSGGAAAPGSGQGQPYAGGGAQAPRAGSHGPLGSGGRTGVGPLPAERLAAGGTAYAAGARGISAASSAAVSSAAAGSAMAAGTAGAGVAGGSAQQDRVARGRGAPGGAGGSFDEEFPEEEQPRGDEPARGRQRPDRTQRALDEEVPPEEAPVTEPSTGRSGRDDERIRRFGVESDDLFEGPVASKPVLGEFE